MSWYNAEIHEEFNKTNRFWIAYVTGFTRTVHIGTRNKIQFIADY